MPAKLKDALLRQRVGRLLRTLPLVAVVLVVAATPVRAAAAAQKLPKPVENVEDLPKKAELKCRRPRL